MEPRQIGRAAGVEWVDRTGPVRTMVYAGEPYGGKPRLAAYRWQAAV